MEIVYLDNAATTSMLPQVIVGMQDSMKQFYANPSSTYSLGRQSKGALETARKKIASFIGAEASEIIFTSGATEAINLILNSTIKDLNVKHIITSKIEHQAVLKTIKVLSEKNKIKVSYVDILESGDIAEDNLVELLRGAPQEKTLVALMHINNEIGSILNLDKVGNLCKLNNALFFTDTVQAIGHYKLNVKNRFVDFAVASAHKFHGPKGIGFAFIRKNTGIKGVQFGGEQERGLRAGTEAIHNIVGMQIALELALENLEDDRETILKVKNYAIKQLKIHVPNLAFNANTNTQLLRNYNLLNIRLPISAEKANTVLFQLDMQGICCSRGSACQSGSNKPSHVLAEVLKKEALKFTSIRLSFSKFTTKNEIDFLVATLKKLCVN